MAYEHRYVGRIIRTFFPRSFIYTGKGMKMEVENCMEEYLSICFPFLHFAGDRRVKPQYLFSVCTKEALNIFGCIVPNGGIVWKYNIRKLITTG